MSNISYDILSVPQRRISGGGITDAEIVYCEQSLIVIGCFRSTFSMRYRNFIIIGLVGIVLAVVVFYFILPPKIITTPKSSNFFSMQLASSAFTHEQSIPQKYSCDGNNSSPPLSISDIPLGAQSLALIMYDPDAPNATHNFDHWIVFNISPTMKTFEEGKNPGGVLGQNGRGQNAYTGPCPPDREHRYFFKLYALDTMLNLPTGANRQQVEAALQGHVLAQAELMGKYERTNN